MNHVRINLEELKSIVTSPRLYLANHFSNLKNQVDLECQIFLQEQTNTVEGRQAAQFALESQQIIISHIVSFENECIRNLDDSTDIKVVDFTELNAATFDALLTAQSTVFLNRTFKFVGRNSEIFKEDAFTSLNFAIKSFGMLIVVEDEFVSDQGFLQGYVSSFEKFNKEHIKGVYLKQQILKQYIEGTLISAVSHISLRLNEQTFCDLSCREIALIDYSVFDNFLRNLKDLKISGNRLSELPDLESLQNLKTIDLRGNQFNILRPCSFRGAENLVSIHLDYNQLTELNESIFQGMINLNDIALYNNQLTTLHPGTFKGLINLKIILLNNNQLTALDKRTFHGLKSLQTLFLNNNQLTSIDPESFDGLKNLKHIDISSNKLTLIHKNTFQGLDSLNLVELYNNQLIALHPKTFRGLDNLEKIMLDSNQLTTLHQQTFQGLANIKEINLRFNDLILLDEFLALFRNLKSLEIIKIDEDFLNLLCLTRPLTTFEGHKRFVNFV